MSRPTFLQETIVPLVRSRLWSAVRRLVFRVYVAKHSGRKVSSKKEGERSRGGKSIRFLFARPPLSSALLTVLTGVGQGYYLQIQ